MSRDAADPTGLRWEAPGPGLWFLTREHFPAPVSRLFASLFPPTTMGWLTSAQRYGLPDGAPRWAAVNGWVYYAPASARPEDYPALEQAAAATLQGARWRDDVRRWHEEDRPRVAAANRALQAEDVQNMDDAALADHLGRAVTHFVVAGTLHFELHTTFSVAGGLLYEAIAEWGLGHEDVVPLLAGSSPASGAAQAHVDRIAAALRAQGAPEPTSVEAIRGAGPEAAAAVDEYLAEYGWRCLDQHEMRGATLIERPEVLLTSVRARLAGVGGADVRSNEATIRERVPAEARDRFDSRLNDAREAYELNDDNVGVTFGWPLGLVRRAVLETARRLVARGQVNDGDHVFETDAEELVGLLQGTGPSSDELEARAARLALAGRAEPPEALGEPASSEDAPLPPSVARLVQARSALWSSGTSPSSPMAGVGIGDTVYRGRACVIDGDGYLALEPGDVIVATVTHAGHNTVFPIGGAVVTQEGGWLSHPAVLARELGLPAVIGVKGLLDRVHTGDIVEVDPVAGVVRVID